MKPALRRKIEAIRNDRTHGANWLSGKTLEVLKHGIERIEAENKKEFLQKMTVLGERLAAAKPAMAPILNNTREIIHALSEESERRDLDPLRRWGIRKILEFLKHSRLAFKNCIRQGGKLIEEDDQIMTGSYSATICQVLKISGKKQPTVRIARSEFGSQNYGELTSRALERGGISNEVFPDKNIESSISKVRKILVGADSILRDGSLINGVPTKRMALAAKKRVPFYVICETAKFRVDRKRRLEDDFDLIPPGLISEIVTEFWRIKPREVARILPGHR